MPLKVAINYRPGNGSLFKADALNYVCEVSIITNEAWIVHLHTETLPASSGAKEIAEFAYICVGPKHIRRIGLGCILET